MYISFYIYLIAWLLSSNHWFNAIFIQQSSLLDDYRIKTP